MDKIPGLDILNASGDGHQPPSIFDETFQMPLNMGSMRTEGDFQYTFMHKIKAQIHLCRGKDLQNKKEITLVIYNETQDPDDELTDILQELEIISDLDQNNILKFYETIAGNTLTDVAFVFEPHASLMSEIIGQKIEKLYEPPVIKTLMRELFTALGYLHKNGIIHGDIQPENIVFTSAGVLKVWNFRNARRVNQKPKKVKVNEFRYQSVELLLESEKYDEATDIWSANCIFVQLWLKKSIFPEHGREKVLEGIFKLLGFPKKDIWEEFYSFPGVNDLLVFSRIARYNMVDRYFMKHCDRAVSPNTMDLIHRCFRYNRKHRPKAEYCLLHPYFIEEPGDPNSLPIQKLMELVRLICCKAVESVQNAAPAAQLCFSIMEKEHDPTFLESLQNCCREWYNERDKLLRGPSLTSVGTAAAEMRRWTAYVSFITELYLRAKNQHCQTTQPTNSGNLTVQLLGPHPNSPTAHLALALQTLLYECANTILKPPSWNCEGEVAILRKMLSSVGQQLEADCSQRMEQLVLNLRDAFIYPSINAQIRKTLLELIELHASGWQQDLPQKLYYFPYTQL